MKVKCEGGPMTDDADSSEDACDEDDRKGDNPPSDVDVKRYFYLKNSGTSNLVLDVEGMSRNGGTPVILWEQKFSTNHHPDNVLNQLWYEDAATSTIRTALNDFCLDAHGQSHFHTAAHLPFHMSRVPFETI